MESYKNKECVVNELCRQLGISKPNFIWQLGEKIKWRLTTPKKKCVEHDLVYMYVYFVF